MMAGNYAPFYRSEHPLLHNVFQYTERWCSPIEIIEMGPFIPLHANYWNLAWPTGSSPLSFAYVVSPKKILHRRYNQGGTRAHGAPLWDLQGFIQGSFIRGLVSWQLLFCVSRALWGICHLLQYILRLADTARSWYTHKMCFSATI